MNGQQPSDSPGNQPQTFKAGDVISPASTATSPEPATPDQSAEPSAPAAAPPQSQPAAVATADTPAPAEPAPAEPSQGFTPERQPSDQPPVSTDQAEPGVISWTASEFIAHDKSASWYGMLALGALLLAALVFLLTRDKISTGVVIVAGLALGVYGARQPQQLRYQLDEHGVTIGQKFYAYNGFRSFAVLDEGAFSSIAFTPLNRFGQLVTIYFDPNGEAAIVDMLANRLPLEERGHDAIDRFMKRIRF